MSSGRRSSRPSSPAPSSRSRSKRPSPASRAAEPVPPRSIVVVGASLAGLRAVESLRREGYDGKLELVGAEDHLPYDRPPLSKKLLAGEWEPERVRLAKNGLDALELDLRLGQRAIELDLNAR